MTNPTTPDVTEGVETAAQGVQDVPDGAAAPEALGDTTNEPQDDDQGEKKPKFREKLQAAEDQRDLLAGQLAAQRQKDVDRVFAAAGLKQGFAANAGIDPAEFLTEDGVLDEDALATRAEEVRVEFGIPRRPQPNPLVGRGNRPEPRESFGDVLRQVARGSD